MAGTQAESSGTIQSEEVPAKKKRMSLSFKAFRQLFSRRKRTKSKDDDVSKAKRKAKAAPETDDATQLGTNKTLSVSHDSVFVERMRETTEEKLEATKSMSVLPQKSPFSAELSQAVRSRRVDDDDNDDDDDDNTNTAESMNIEIKADTTTGLESDQSLMSIGDSSGEELEGEFFKDNWGVSSGSKLSSPEPSNENGLNLDIVVSNSSLNTSMLDHKRQVRRKNVRPSSKHQRATAHPRTTSPKPPAGSVQVLPLVKEEQTAKQEEELSDTEEIPDPAETSAPEVEQETKPDDSDKQDEDKPKKTDDDESKVKKVEFCSVVLRKTSQREEKAEGDVVMRRDSPGQRHDTSKRVTIASGTDISIFGERKVNKRSSLSESKNWEDGKEKKEGEFTAVFSRIQHRPSVKLIELQKEGENLEDKRKKEKDEVQKILSSPKQERSSDSATKANGVSAKIEVAERSSDSVTKASVVAAKIEVAERGSDSVTTANGVAATVAKVDTKSSDRSSSGSESGKTSNSKPDAVKSQPKTVTLVIEKSPVSPATSSGENKENTNYKRPSPLNINRARRQTLPEQSTVITDQQRQNEASPKTGKKSALTSVEGGSNSSSPSSKTNSPQRSASVLIKSGSGSHIQPKRLTIKDSNSGSKPAWIEAAKKKRVVFSDDGENDESKTSDGSEKNDESKTKDEKAAQLSDLDELRAKRKSVKDMVNKWQR